MLRATYPLRVACALLVLLTASFALAGDRPNVVVILADDMGYGDVRALNPDSSIPTPALDSLATDGMTFTDAHSPSAVCTPTRYGLLTGRYCWRTRLKRGVLNGYGEPLIDVNRETIASFMADAGYQCGIVGKWHLGLGFAKHDEGFDFRSPVSPNPNDYGFHHSFIIPASLDFPPYVYIRNGEITAYPEIAQKGIPFPRFVRNGERAPDLDFGQCLDDLIGEANKFIRQQAENDESPFFLYVPLTAPHKPVWPHERFAGKSGLGPYGDFVMQVDAMVGSVLETIDDCRIRDNTIVIYTSDNGSFMYRRDDEKDHVDDETVQAYRSEHHTANALWRGTKADVWEAGHRVPFFVRWPATIEPDSKSAATICLVDVFATLAEVIDRPVPEGTAPDSFSMLAQLKDASAPSTRAPVINHSAAGMFAIRAEQWKLVLGNGSGGRQQPRGAPFEKPYGLFNLADDPGETTNLIDSHPEIARELERKFNLIHTEEDYRQYYVEEDEDTDGGDNELIEYAKRAQFRQAYGVYMQGQKLGWSIQELKLVEDADGEPTLTFTDEMTMISEFLGEREVMKSRSVTRYALTGDGDLQGELIEVDEDGQRTVTRAIRTPQGYKVTQQIGDQRTTRRVGLTTDNVRQMMAVDRWLSGNRQPGDQFETVSADFESADVESNETLTIVEKSEIAWGGMPTEVYDVELEMQGSTSELTITPDGRVLQGKFGGLLTIRAESEATARNMDGPPVDLFAASSIAVDRDLGEPAEIKRLVLKIEADEEFDIPQSHRQVLTRDGDHWRLELRRGFRMEEPEPLSDEDRQLYLRSTPRLLCDHDKLINKSKEIAGTSGDANERAGKLSQWVFANLEQTAAANASTALQVLDQRRGDCTEHAILFVSLARAAGIPAREVSGIMYAGEGAPFFAWHAWAEIHDGHQWISVDPTWNQFHVDGTHIALGLGESDLSWTNFIGRLKITVAEVERD